MQELFLSSAFLINISCFLTLFTVIPIGFLFSPVILYWLFVLNCLFHFAPKMIVLLDKLALFLNCAAVALGRLMDSVPKSSQLPPVCSFFLASFCAFYALFWDKAPFEVSDTVMLLLSVPSPLF